MGDRSHFAAQAAFLCAALCAGLVFLFTVIGAAAFPGYSHVSRFISELGATGAPHALLVRFGGFLPAGLLMSAFAVAAFKSLPKSGVTALGLVGLGIYALGYVAAAFFPCDAGCRPSQPSVSQVIHNAMGLVGYVLAPICLFALGFQARRWPSGTQLARFSFVAAALCLMGLLTLSPKSPFVGLSQRIIESSVLLWCVMCGVYIRSRFRAAT